MDTVNYIKDVKEFMTTAGQPTPVSIIDIPEDRNKLRIALIFEELKEYAEASGLSYTFKHMCNDYIPLETQEVNQVEQLDALLDLQYVLSGAVIEHGFDGIFDEGFKLVQESNMSKFCITEIEAIDTVNDYTKQNIQTFHRKEGEFWVVYRVLDLKVLKSHKYKVVDLKPLLLK